MIYPFSMLSIEVAAAIPGNKICEMVSPNTHSQDYLNQDESDNNVEYNMLLAEISVNRPVSDSHYKAANTKLPPDTHSQDYLSQNSSIEEPTEEASYEQGNGIDGGADDGGGVCTLVRV